MRLVSYEPHDRKQQFGSDVSTGWQFWFVIIWHINWLALVLLSFTLIHTDSPKPGIKNLCLILFQSSVGQFECVPIASAYVKNLLCILPSPQLSRVMFCVSIDFQSGHSLLSSLISKVFHAEFSLLMFIAPFCVNSRVSCVWKIPGDLQFLSYSNQLICNRHPCYG